MFIIINITCIYHLIINDVIKKTNTIICYITEILKIYLLNEGNNHANNNINKKHNISAYSFKTHMRNNNITNNTKY